jgi:tetratricopeptide (TPR) repeat protein
MNLTQSFFTIAANRIYLAGLFLLPTILVWSAMVSPQSLKMVVAAVMLIGALTVSALGAFKRGGFMVPMSPLLGAAWLLPFAYIVSSVFAPSFLNALVGSALDTDTVLFMALLALAASLPYFVFEHKSDYTRAFQVLFVSAAVVALFHLVRLFLGSDALSFGIFTSPLFSPLGKWNDVSIFFGLVGLLSLVALESVHLKGMHRTVLGVALAVSLFFVAVVNFVAVWVVLGIAALGIVLYRALLSTGNARMSVASSLVLVVAVLAVIFTGTFGAQLGRSFGVEQIEARPSWGSTVAVATQTLASSPIVGSGPNTFLFEWDKYRPSLINQSVFWNADFTSGVGLIPTSLIATGLLGLLAWVGLIGLFLLSGVMGLLLRTSQDQTSFHLLLVSFVGALYILVMSVIYLPSVQLLIVGFALLGMFGALYHRERNGTTVSLDFKERPRLGFVAVLGLALTLVVSVLTLYGVGTVFASNIQFERASRAAQVDGNMQLAGEYLDSANSLFAQDRYYRLGVLIHIAEMNVLVNSDPSAMQADEAQQKFQKALGAAVESGLQAVRLNDQNYRNWQSVSSAYQSVIPLNIDGSYEAAVNALQKAQELNASMPSLPFARAQIEIVRQKTPEARAFIEEALALKQDFTPALLLLAQIELNSGNLKEAIKRAESASVFEPSNPVMQFQVGVLKFENKDYAGAETALKNAVSLAPDYANARYYLGRVLLTLGNKDGALKEFAEVERLNPDNADIKGVTAAIQAGTDPFAPAPEPKKK